MNDSKHSSCCGCADHLTKNNILETVMYLAAYADREYITLSEITIAAKVDESIRVYEVLVPWGHGTVKIKYE